MEVKPVVLPPTVGDKSLAIKRRMLRDSIDESGWKHDAVAAAIALKGHFATALSVLLPLEILLVVIWIAR